MHLRTLRLLISVSAIIIVFIYLASLQVSDNLPVHLPDEGTFGGPVAGLTKRQAEKFTKAKEVFEKTFAVSDGLGPMFNEQSCAACHNSYEPGSKLKTSAWIGKRRSAKKPEGEISAALKDKIESPDFDPMAGAAGGPLLVRRSITEQFKNLENVPANCTVAGRPFPPADAEFVSTRIPSKLIGLGFIDTIPDHALNWQANVQKQRKNGIAGTPNVSGNAILGWSPVGRFGDKAQDKTLYQSVARELAMHLGVSSPLHPNAVAPQGGLPVCIKQAIPQDPNDNGKLVAQITYYLSLLAPPPRGEITEAVQHGERTFMKLGCAECHISEYRTPAKVFVLDPDGQSVALARSPVNPDEFEMQKEPRLVEIKALESYRFNCYSDFLLHEMGPDLADGICQGQARGGQWRTAPLWGIGSRSEYLHDGRANTLERAVSLHGGEAAEAAKKFDALPKNVKDDVVDFLKSL